MLLNKAQRADVCDDEAHFSTGDGREDEDIVVRVLVWRQKHRHGLCGQGHPSWLWSWSIFWASLFPNVGLSF